MDIFAPKEEVLSVMSRLKRVYGLTFADMGDAIGETTSKISNYKQGKTRMPLSKLQELKDHFEKVDEIPIVSDVDPKYSKKIPFYKTDAFATISPAMQGAIPLTPETFMYVPYLQDSEFSVLVTGHSMKGYINHGDQIGVRRIYDVDRIFNGKCYYIISKANNLKTVKFLKKHKTDDNLLWMIPYNKNQFEEETIEKSDILELYIVNLIFRPA